MVASPNLSKYFYEYEARTGRVHATPDNSARSPLPSGPVRRRGMPADTSRKRLSDEQPQTIIELLKTTPNAAAAARKFAEAHREPGRSREHQARNDKAREIEPARPSAAVISIKSTFPRLGAVHSRAGSHLRFGQIGSA
jgi:hypothetical protein